MIKRCNNPKANNYHNYGGRGIRVCERWLRFENFIADMGYRPAAHSLDRIDNDKNYEPSNCRWADAYTQNNNKRKPRGSVYFFTSRNKWRARITQGQKRVHLGYFNSKEQALESVRIALTVNS